MIQKDKVVVGYIDGTDWQHEIEESPDGVKVYPSVSSIRERRACVEEYGIVEVEIRVRKVVCEPKI